MSAQYDDILAVRKELAAKGLLRDSGRRRNRQLLWEITELGRQVLEIARKKNPILAAAMAAAEARKH